MKCNMLEMRGKS